MFDFVKKLWKALVDIVRAIFESFFGVDVSYHPRREKTGARIETDEMIASILKGLDQFSFESTDPAKTVDPKMLMDRAKDSMEEAKKQTEYQDGKAGRLLTIVAFLTAAVGTVFGKFVDTYPLHSPPPAGATSPWVTASYLLFGIYLLLVASGALVTFHAMSTRFVWPKGSNLADEDHVRSLLFYQQVVRTKQEAWGKAFTDDKSALLRTYYKNYVTEAYLISAKVADKLRYLDPGQKLLLWGIRVLLALFVVVMLSFALVAPPTKAADKRDAPVATTHSSSGQAASEPQGVGAASGAKMDQAPNSSPQKSAKPASGG
jgi:hypothetical protein